MSRAANEKWLVQGIERNPGGWEDRMVGALGMEGALDVLAVQAGNPWGIDLRHRPWAGDPELKELVLALRAADAELSRVLHQRMSEVWSQ